MAVPAIQDSCCPNCGAWTVLVEDTGWCASCTQQYTDDKVCTSCGALFPKSAQVDKCWDCRKEEWLARNADRIEHYMILGYTFTRACSLVRNDIRPTCKNCGKPIQGGRKSANFCRRAECRKASKSFRTLKQMGLTPYEALAIATQRVSVLVSK